MADDKTIGAAGDYTTVPLWAAYVTALGTLTQDTNGLHLNEATTSASQALWAPAGGLGGFTLTFRAQTGAGFPDLRNPVSDPLSFGAPGARCTCTGTGVGQNFYTSVTMSISKMQIAKTGQYSGVFRGPMIGSQVFMLRNDTSGDNCFNNTGTWTDCNFIFQTNSNAFGPYDTAGEFYNCVLANTSGGGGTTGLRATYGTFIAKNTAVYGFATATTGTAGAACANNATDLGAFGGTNWNGGTPQISIVGSDEWEDPTGAGDWRLKSTSTKLKANGTTGAGVSANDIYGNGWNAGTPDIGSIRYAAAAGGNATFFAYTRNHLTAGAVS